MLNEEATNANCIVFGKIRSRLEPMIYRIQDGHAYHYTTDAVQILLEVAFNTKIILEMRLII